MNKEFYKEIKKTINTNLLFSDIEILDYHKEGILEILKIELPFTTTGNILTYKYNPETEELKLLNGTIYIMKDNHKREKAYIDRATIMKIYDYCRNNIEHLKGENTTNETKTEALYKILVKGLPLTKETLSIYKFTEEDLKTLIEQNIIRESSPSTYTLTSVEDMYNYGVKLELNNQTKQSENCFRKCYQIDPNNRKVCLQLMLLELKKHNYIAVQRIFAIIENLNKGNNIEDNKLYLYLLSTILFTNEEYQERMKNIDFDELLIPDNIEYKNKEKQNEIRGYIIKQKFPYATKLINDLMRKDLAYNVEHELLKELVIQALTVNKKFKDTLKIAAQNKNYYRIIELLEKKSKNKYLGNMETYILLVTKSILKVTETNQIPEITTYTTNNMYEAILGNNFELTRKINLDFINKTNQDASEDTLNILLNDLLERIALTEKNIVKTEEEQEKTSFLKTNNNIISTNQLSEDEEMAYYIKEIHMSLKEATKKMGLHREQTVLIKLIYARDYFVQGKYEEGDKLLQEVENSAIITDRISDLLKEIKEIIMSKDIKTNTYTKTRN